VGSDQLFASIPVSEADLIATIGAQARIFVLNRAWRGSYNKKPDHIGDPALSMCSKD
jgi:hypothetical protein